MDAPDSTYYSNLLISCYILPNQSINLQIKSRPSLKGNVLHWLPVPLRVEFKISLLVYKSLHGAAPGYLHEYCKETHSSASGLRLRSTDKCDLHVRRMKTRFGDRAFSAAGAQLLEQTSCCSAYSRLD